MKLPCPVCDSETRVYDTRLQDGFVRRRRECENGHRFNTAEERVSPVWDHNRQVVPVKLNDYDIDIFRSELVEERKGVE